MDDINNKTKDMKIQQRRAALLARASLSPELRASYSAAICDEIAKMPWVKAARTVLSYRATSTETDPAALDAALAARGAEIYYPLCNEDGSMSAVRPLSDDAWRKSALGIWEPVLEHSQVIAPAELELVIVPCVAFDAQCSRLGRGAGFYDRFLPLCDSAFAVCPAFELQKLEHVITDERDYKVDAVISECARYTRTR